MGATNGEARRTMKPITADPARSYALPGWAYTQPDVFAREKDAIFYRGWHYAGPLAALRTPGDYLTAGVVDQNIFVVRGHDGVLRGFYNVCQHRGHELLKGRGNVKLVITCPYHAWAYDPDGSLRTARGAEKMTGFDRSEFGLKPVRVETFADHFVFFNLDANAAPLAQQAGDLAEELRAEIVGFDRIEPMLERSGSIRCNWKVAVDNYLECYHCGPAHPAFADMLDMKGYRTVTKGIWSSQKGDIRRTENAAYTVRRNAPQQRGLFWWLWPSTTFNVLPGSPGVAIFNFMPAAPDLTLTTGDRFLVPGEQDPDEDAARQAYGRNVLGPEDVALCESVHRGLASRGYGQGRFIADAQGTEMSENAVHHFHRLVARAIEL
ncbi:MAG: aromatic ring-hydroxylating oxygenase subunit alpha [Alphaproteobacteria bacterium]